MDFDTSDLIRAINETNDNIWLGDFNRAKEIVDSKLEKIGQNDILVLENAAQEIRRKTYELRRIARKNGIKKKRSWVLAQLFQDLAKKEIDPVKSITGVCVINLLGLKEMIGLLTERSSQKRLDETENNQKEERMVHTDKLGNRYSLDRLSDRWDVRAILNKRVQPLERSKIRKLSVERGAFLEVKSEGLRSNVFELFGRDIYAQTVGLNKHVEISMRVPKSEDEENKVIKFVEEILDALIS